MMRTHVLLILLVVATSVRATFPTSNRGPDSSHFSEVFSTTMARLATFVDVNNDRRTDTIVVNQDNGLEVLLEPDARKGSANIFEAAKQQLPQKHNLLSGDSFPKTIRGIIASDFDGDSVADLMVLMRENEGDNFEVSLCFGAKEGPNGYILRNPETLGTFLHQPMIGDFNADGIADIYGETSAGKRAIVYGGADRKLVHAQGSASPWNSLSYAAFGDFMASSTPSHIIFLQDGSFEFLANSYVAKSDQWPDISRASKITIPTEFNAKVIGQFRFFDFNRDDNLDFIVPICKTDDCVDSSALLLYNLKNKTWVELGLSLNPPGFISAGKWSFTLQDDSLGLSTSALAGMTHGDVDLDSWADLTAILTYKDSDGKVYKVPAVLMNNGGNSFQAYLIPGYNLSDQEAVQLAFFDQNEDGVLDLWVTTKHKDQANNAKPTFSTRLFVQAQSNNNYFLMVMHLSGLCPNKQDCMGFGVPLPGNSASFKTYSFNGVFFHVTAVATPISTCNAMELPYILFGLGELANYIEEVNVRILSDRPNSKPSLERTIDFTVPESQLVVNPYTRLQPSDWKITLYLQPLRNLKVLLIAVTLFCLMLFLSILIATLQCCEVRQEREEKMQEAQGYHF